MKAEELIHDLASILFEPEIYNALDYFNRNQNHGRQNTVAYDLLRKRDVLRKVYTQYKGQLKAGRVPEAPVKD